MNKKFSEEVNTKISNEITKIKASFTVELGKINNEVDAKLERFVNKLNN